MIKFTFLHPKMTDEMLGLLPAFFNEDDPDSAAEQIDKNYRHGGGFVPFPDFTLNPDTLTLTYPGDPPLEPLAKALLRSELIVFYRGSWVAIIQEKGKGSFQVARVD